MPARSLLVTADDFGIGDATSRGILDLAVQGVVTSTVLLVNSPHAESAVTLWKSRGCPVELGWHPCLTLDRPILPASRVPSLVDAHGQFLHLSAFLKKILRGAVDRREIEAELHAQYDRFRELVGQVPMNVNAHHHVHIFQPVREILIRILASQPQPPFVRRVVETRRSLTQVPGGRIKRLILSAWGARAARAQALANLPGAAELIGVTNPECVQSPQFFANWLRAASCQHVELTCHPGYWDESLIGRDGSPEDGQLHRRVTEMKWLSEPSFRDAVREAGFQLVTASVTSSTLPPRVSETPAA